MIFKDEHSKKVLTKYGQESIARMAKILSGTKLKDKISFELVEKEDLISIEFKIPEYGKFVDSGRKPGSKYPPFTAIEKWAKDKKLPQFRVMKSWKSTTSRTVGRFLSTKTRTFLLARSIAKKGIIARPFLNIPELYISELTKSLSFAVAEDVAVSLQEVFNEAGIGKK